MAKQFIFAVPYSNSALGTVVMLGKRRIIQRRKAGKPIVPALIPHWAGQLTLIGGAATVARPAYGELAAIYLAQTGSPLPVAETAAIFISVQTKTGLEAAILPVPMQEAELNEAIRAANLAIQGLKVADGVFEEIQPVAALALDEALHPTPVPEGGWSAYMNRFYFQDFRPGPLDPLPPIILAQLTKYSQQDPALFRLGIETLPEVPVTVEVTGIAVVGASQGGANGSYAVPYAAEGIVQLQAELSTSDPLAGRIVAWTVDGKEAGSGPDLTLTADQLTAKGAPILITARLGNSQQTVTLTVRPEFDRFWIEGAEQVEVADNDRRLKAVARYGAAAAPVVVRMTLRPNKPDAYDFLTWTGGEPLPGPNDRRAVSRRAVTAKGAPAKVTARLNPEFEAEVAVLPVLAGLRIDEAPVPQNGQVTAVYTTVPDAHVELRAVTEPEGETAWGHLVWTGGEAGAATNLRRVPITGLRPGDPPVKVTVQVGDGPARVAEVRIVPRLLGLDLLGPGEMTGAAAAQAFRSADGPPVVLQARFDPPGAASAAHAVWEGEVVDWRSPDTKAVRRDIGADALCAIRVRVAEQAAALALSLTTPEYYPTMGLTVSEIGFPDTAALNDDDNVPIDPVWRAGHPAPPVSFPRDQAINLSARLSLNPRPGANAQINLRATAWLPLVDGSVQRLRWVWPNVAVAAAGPAPDTIALAAALSDAHLPNEVSYQSHKAAAALAARRWPMQLLWEVQTVGAGGWSQIGTTQHPTLIMQAAPAAVPAYLGPFYTCFDIACRNADGARDAGGARAGSYAAFEARDPATGANPQLRRTSDGLALVYWGSSPEAGDLEGLLAHVNGSGTCATFAQMFLAMLAAHGMAPQTYTQVKPNTALVPEATGFGVAIWAFNPVPTPMTYAGWNYRWQAGGGANTGDWASGPGQNQPAPPKAFLNHFIVTEGQACFDPSYGTPLQANLESWSRLSVNALLRAAGPLNAGYAGPAPIGFTATRIV